MKRPALVIERRYTFLVASLIRQESEFNPAAVSRANAVGLMQLLPTTGKQVAKDLKVKHFNPSELYLPQRLSAPTTRRHYPGASR